MPRFFIRIPLGLGENRGKWGKTMMLKIFRCDSSTAFEIDQQLVEMI